jgi:hypothetical protein
MDRACGWFGEHWSNLLGKLALGDPSLAGWVVLKLHVEAARVRGLHHHIALATDLLGG